MICLLPQIVLWKAQLPIHILMLYTVSAPALEHPVRQNQQPIVPSIALKTKHQVKAGIYPQAINNPCPIKAENYKGNSEFKDSI